MPHFADRIREMALREKKNRIEAAQGNTYIAAVYRSKKGRKKEGITARKGK